MRRRGGLIPVILILSVAGSREVAASPGPECFGVRVDDVEGSPVGCRREVGVWLDFALQCGEGCNSTGYMIQAWALGICSEPNVLKPVAARLGEEPEAYPCSGIDFDFVRILLSQDGVIHGIVPSFFCLAVVHGIPPVNNFRAIVITYDVKIGPMEGGEVIETEVSICDTLGSPRVVSAVVVEGASVPFGSQKNGIMSIIEGGRLTRGDFNNDGRMDIADAIAMLSYLFAGGHRLACEDAADANDDGRMNIADAVRVLVRVLYGLFYDQNVPSAPFPDPGEDPTEDELLCCRFEPTS